jgi:hypothetical protein
MPPNNANFPDKLDFGPNETGVPDEITAFAELEEKDNFSDELADLLNFLNTFFNNRMVMDGNGNPAAVIPKYNSMSGVDADEWINRAPADADPAIVKNGELVRFK